MDKTACEAVGRAYRAEKQKRREQSLTYFLEELEEFKEIGKEIRNQAKSYKMDSNTLQN